MIEAPWLEPTQNVIGFVVLERDAKKQQSNAQGGRVAHGRFSHYF